MNAKLRAEYGPVLHMPVLKEGKKDTQNSEEPYGSAGYALAGKEKLCCTGL